MGQTTSFSYRNDGTLHESTDYLSDVTDFSQDSYGRVGTLPDPMAEPTPTVTIPTQK
jgi:hypothetical protein